MIKIFINFVFLLICVNLFAQTPQVNNHYYNYDTKNTNFDGFKYQNQYYETSPKGLLSFIDDNNSDFSPELESILLQKAKKIKTKALVSEIAGWGLWASGGVIMFSGVASGQDENGKYDTSTIFKGFGVAIFGALIKELVRPKSRNYYDFINTVNRKQSKKVYLEVTYNYEKNLNFGFAVNF
jgi:hypothetical protein